jgi:hypothetical protein
MATNNQFSAHRKNSSPDTVISDDIMDELESFRESWAAQCDYDIGKMLADAREFAKTHPVGRPASIKPAERKLPVEKAPAA